MNNLVKACQLLILAATLLTPGMASADHKAFRADSLKQIEQQYAGKTFLLVLWEISCFPCHEEMALLGTLKQEHPDANVVMISTDDISKQQEISTMLESHGLEDIDSWLFADPNIEKLRYTIDPEWFGELPRNYIYDTDSSRFGMSGKLTQEILDEWLIGI